MDYQKLLTKYMAHVADCEGVTFVNDGTGYSDVKFTPEEWAELRAVNDLVEASDHASL